MDKEEVNKLVKRRRLEDSLKQDFALTLDGRMTRYMELDFIEITPNTHFASISAECIFLYRDGYYLACIALCQAVAEALVRFMCEINNFGASISKDFEENVNKLHKRHILPDCKDILLEIWKGRHDYHHLKPNIESDRVKLQQIAKEKIITLHKIEAEVFAYSVVNGAIKPKFQKYWDITNGRANVFLRIEP